MNEDIEIINVPEITWRFGTVEICRHGQTIFPDLTIRKIFGHQINNEGIFDIWLFNPTYPHERIATIEEWLKTNLAAQFLKFDVSRRKITLLFDATPSANDPSTFFELATKACFVLLDKLQMRSGIEHVTVDMTYVPWAKNKKDDRGFSEPLSQNITRRHRTEWMLAHQYDKDEAAPPTTPAPPTQP